MLQKSLFLSFLYGFLVFISSCCNCSNIPTTRYQWTTLEIYQAHYTKDSNGVLAISADSAPDFTHKNYAIQGRLQYEFIARRIPPRLGLGNVAYACKCPLEKYVALASAGALRVYTVHYFNRRHPPQSDATDLFKTLKEDSDKDLQPVKHSFQEQVNDYAPRGNFDLYLTQKPERTGTHQFRVEIQLADGTIRSALTPEIQL